MQKLSDDEFKEYFLNRIDKVIIPRALYSGGNEVVTKTVQGRTFRVGSYPRGIDKKSNDYFQCRAEYRKLKDELMRRSIISGEYYTKNIMKEAEKRFEVHIEKIWNRYQQVVGGEMNSLSEIRMTADFIELFDDYRDKDKALKNLLDKTFGEMEKQNY
ncbi:MAG: hypothetical protein D6734_11340 [Candidatus Schekmanbacteria bacterium]|nr:MAG: hypothetical protein D6734_11340 [Candidatus Schekmanbacteria bacterium]